MNADDNTNNSAGMVALPELSFFHRFRSLSGHADSDSDPAKTQEEPFALASDILKAEYYYTATLPSGADCKTVNSNVNATAEDIAACNYRSVTDQLATLEKERANGEGQYTDEFLKFGKIQMHTAQLWLGIGGMVYLLYRNE